jgi:hypothetical protein
MASMVATASITQTPPMVQLALTVQMVQMVPSALMAPTVSMATMVPTFPTVSMVQDASTPKGIDSSGCNVQNTSNFQFQFALAS